VMILIGGMAIDRFLGRSRSNRPSAARARRTASFTSRCRIRVARRDG
jgi:hypothetical protein